MRRIFIFLTIVTLISHFNLPAQTVGDDPKPVWIGDQCPNLSFIAWNDQGSRKISLHDLKGKLVIVDFWATYCGPCIDALYEMDSLVRKFGDQLVVITITYEKEALIRDFLSKKPRLKANQLLWVTDDAVTRKYFPHHSISHDVWIGTDSKIAAVTYSKEVTTKNINLYFKNGSLDLPVKMDVMDQHPQLPLLMGLTGSYKVPVSKLVYSSTLTEVIEGITAHHGAPRRFGKGARLLSTYGCIQSLYQEAFFPFPSVYLLGKDPGLFGSQICRVILEVKDSSRFFWPGKKSKDWPDMPFFCYEIILPTPDTMRILPFMQQDLNRLFGLLFKVEAKVENRTMPCWVIQRSGTPIPASQFTQPEYRYKEALHTGFLHRKTLRDFLFYSMNITLQLLENPWVDETDFDQPFDMDFTGVDLTSFPEVKSLLEKYGFRVTKANRKIDMLVIRDLP